MFGFQSESYVAKYFLRVTLLNCVVFKVLSRYGIMIVFYCPSVDVVYERFNINCIKYYVLKFQDADEVLSLDLHCFLIFLI